MENTICSSLMLTGIKHRVGSSAGFCSWERAERLVREAVPLEPACVCRGAVVPRLSRTPSAQEVQLPCGPSVTQNVVVFSFVPVMFWLVRTEPSEPPASLPLSVSLRPSVLAALAGQHVGCTQRQASVLSRWSHKGT